MKTFDPQRTLFSENTDRRKADGVVFTARRADTLFIAEYTARARFDVCVRDTLASAVKQP